MKDLNLVPKFYLDGSKRFRKALLKKVGIIMTGLALIAAFAIPLYLNYRAQHQLQELNTKMAELKVFAEWESQSQQMQDMVKERSQEYDFLNAKIGNYHTLKDLEAIERILPPQVRFVSVNMELNDDFSSSYSISGVAMQQKDLETYVQSLRTLEKFKDVTIQNITWLDGEKNYSFSMQIRFVK